MFFIISLVVILLLSLLFSLLFQKEDVSITGFKYNITDLIQDGMKVFLYRLSSISIQLLLYGFLILLGTYLLGVSALYLTHFLSFSFGFLSVLIGHFLTLFLTKKVLVSSIGFLTLTTLRSVRAYLKLSFSVMLSMVLPVLTGLILIVKYTSVNNSLLYLLGILLAVFFLRVGGGIFRSSAEVAKLVVARVESSFPQDFRNPVTYLDFIGQCIGNITGFSSNILSSYSIVIVSFFLAFNIDGSFINSVENITISPFLFVYLTLITSFLSYVYAYYRSKFYSKNILLESIYVAMIANICLSYFIFYNLEVQSHNSFFFVYLIGVLGSVLIAYFSDLISSVFFKFGKKTLERTEMGPALVLFQNMSNGFLGIAIVLTVLTLLIFCSYYVLGIYGISLMSLGFLSVMPLLISSKVFLNLSDMACRINTLDHDNDGTHMRSRALAKIGRTINPVGSGFSAVSAVLASISLVTIANYLGVFNVVSTFKQPLFWIVFVATIMVTYLFTCIMINGFADIISKIRVEVMRQFREIPYLIEGQSFPDILKASNFQTILTLKILSLPLIIVLVPTFFVSIFLPNTYFFALTLGVGLVVLLHVFYWAILGDSIEQSREYVNTGYYGGREGLSYQYLSYAYEYSLIYSMILAPNYLVLLKFLSVVLAILLI